MRSLLLAFWILQIANCTCPPGFEFMKDYGECRGNYTRINTYWDDAASDVINLCNGILGVPIIIHNEEQQTYWRNKVNSENEWTTIGLVCNTKTMQWEWVDGSPIDYKPPNYYSKLDESCFIGCSWVIRTDGHWSCGTGHGAYPTDVFCTSPSRQPIPSADECDNFDDDSDDGVCYQIGTSADNFQDAQLKCANVGANVASIHKQQENSFIRRLAVSKGAIDGVFLGATVSGKGHDFAWADGTMWDYENFYPGFPISGLGDCLVMDTAGTSGEWANTDCSSKLSVACMRKANYTAACSSGPWREGDIIYTPGFPYDASVPCDFILTAAAGKTVELEILLLEANPCCDHLIVYENYIGANVIAILTGIVNDTTTYKTSSSNFMRVSWQPNGGVNVRGSLMRFRGV